MFRILGFSTLLSSYVLAQIPVNNTIVSQCSSNLVNCTTYNYTDNNITNNMGLCVNTFNSCMKTATGKYRPPASCYQASAARVAFRYAWIFVVSLFTFSIIVSSIPVSARFFAIKCNCCNCFKNFVGIPNEEDPLKIATSPTTKEPTKQPETTPNHTPQTTLALVQGLSGISIEKVGVFFSGMVSFASASWIFQLWQAQTVTDASCRYDLYQDLPDNQMPTNLCPQT